MTTTPEQLCPHTHAACDTRPNARCSVCPLRSPSPEQLQAWREKFESFYSDERECLLTRDANSGDYVNEAIDSAWMGYLRCCQENEQAMKLAKFGAMVIRDDSKGGIDKREILQYAILADVTSPEVEATIKELLNE